MFYAGEMALIDKVIEEMGILCTNRNPFHGLIYILKQVVGEIKDTINYHLIVREYKEDPTHKDWPSCASLHPNGSFYT